MVKIQSGRFSFSPTRSLACLPLPVHAIFLLYVIYLPSAVAHSKSTIPETSAAMSETWLERIIIIVFAVFAVVSSHKEFALQYSFQQTGSIH